MRPLADLGFLTFTSIAPMLEPVVLPDTFLALKERVVHRRRRARPSSSSS
jgi:hypothetical protein